MATRRVKFDGGEDDAASYKTALCARQGCRSKAGHHPTQRNTVNVGNAREALMLGMPSMGRANAA